jgi:ADP-ribosylglycohydrolase
MPACLYAYDRGLTDDEAVKVVNDIGGLTHNHPRAKMACGLYFSV